MPATDLKIQLQTLPTSAGIYQYFDSNDNLLYIGKAKNLKKRVLSYFTKTHDNAKTRILVKKIASIKHIVVETETDALILENNLIKKYQPKYNIMLKDDKTYPWLCIKNESFPRVFSTRRVIKDGSEYFGPYTSGKTVSVLLDLIRELFMLRTCNFDLSPTNIANKKHCVCLDYHIGNCKGPCEGLQSESDYLEDINAIRNILKGHFKPSLKKFEVLMNNYAADLQFEAAQKIKEKIDILANYQAKSTVVNPSINNVDVFSILSDDEFAYVNFLKISNGAIIQSHTAEIKKKLNETDKEILTLSIIEIRQRFQSQSTEIYVPIKINVGETIKVTIPLQGDKKRIVDLSLRNAKYYRQERFKQIKIIDPERHSKRILGQMKTDLHLQVEPAHIECFDNSNIQGTNPVAACVVFKNAKPSKKDYRHFNIKTVEGPDDFASMKEVIYRRYKRMLDEQESLPQLIIIDGGKGQLSSALKSLEALNLRGKIAIIGIAKRLEELYYPDDKVPLYLDKRSETLKIIQQLRDEAHRFGITHHRNKRSKQALKTDLIEIPGIGNKLAEVLLKHYKSVKRIKEADLNGLISILGQVLGKKVYEFYKKNN